jgi:excisionase family DNA binding protein
MEFQKPSPTGEINNRFLELEAQLMCLLADMRAAMSCADEETRRARAEDDKFNIEIFTEEEAAGLLKVSADTLARLRTSHHLPYLRVGVQIRYTHRHLIEIAGLLEQRVEGKKGKQRLLRSL